MTKTSHFLPVSVRAVAFAFLAFVFGAFLLTPKAGAAVTPMIAAGGYHTCALFADGRVKCWGRNANGELGLGDTNNRGDNAGEMGTTLPFLNLGRGAVALAAGASHTCALLDNGNVKCWGSNATGQLGLGDTAARGDGPGEMGASLPVVNLGTGRTATAIAAGFQHSCALLDNSTVKCWGRNAEGQLGLGDFNSRGDNVGEMGDALPAVSLGTARTTLSIATGGYHTCARLDNSTVKCWGYNPYGQLGLGDNVARGDNAGEMGDALPAVNLGTGRTAVSVTAGVFFSCARLDNSAVKCWGYNVHGQLGLGDTNNRGDNAGEMGDALLALNLGTGRTAVKVDAGPEGFNPCALLDNSTVKCWGYNLEGELGLGDTAHRGDSAGEMGDALPAVSLGTGRTAAYLDVGSFHTCVILDNGAVKCWGYNGYGQLGLGDTTARGSQATQMGDNLPVVNLGFSVTAANVGVSGRVLNAAGYGVRAATVSFVGSDGTRYTAITNAFGYYSLPNVPAGETYMANVSSRGLVFVPRAVTVTDQLTGVDFSAQ